ncbi:MAG: hypothetical protein KDC26_10270 [Armatimonadetes bacterium]|nr:hypothetical protein [Armatimonadota bacterium]
MIASTLSLLIALSTPTLNVKVDGEGYFRLARNGEVAYAKSVSLTVTGGKLATNDGAYILPVVIIKGTPSELSSDLQGRITADFNGQKLEVGRFVLATFPDDVRPVESNGLLKIFGEPTLGEPGEGLNGVIRSVEEGAKPVGVPVRSNSTGTQPKTNSQSETITAPQRPVAPGMVRVQLRELAEVSGLNVRMDQVANIIGEADLARQVAQISVTTPPPIGIDRKIDQARVISRLRGAGLDINKIELVGEFVIVRQESQEITHQTMVTSAQTQLIDEYGILKPESDRIQSSFYAPKGETKLTVEGTRRSGQALSTTVVIWVDGQRINSRTLRFVADSPAVDLSIGQSVTVQIVSGDVSVEMPGKVQKVDKINGLVTVKLDTGAVLTGRWTPQGFVKVKA